MQWRLPVGWGPSSNTCPKCDPQRRQWHSVRTMKNLRSSFVATAFSCACQKLGQPVPECICVQMNKAANRIPDMIHAIGVILSKGEVKARSVPLAHDVIFHIA